ncbi:MAG: RHS repeat-associated core domain-containing protein [Thermodesulfovibrionales bacterium]|nr:RHS repeat-associated core domain-containing protein [Thermodesulfovibrionales bacterium]
MKILSLIFGILLLCVGIAYALDSTILGTIPLDKAIDSVALAPNTGTAYGISSEEKILYIFDLKNYTVKKKITLSKKPNAIAVNQSNNLAFVTSKESENKGLLYVVDSEGNILKTVDLPKDPQGIAVTPDNSTAVIAIEKDQRLLFLSTATYTVTKTIDLPHRPKLISLDIDTNRAIVIAGKAQGEGKQNIVLIVDLNTGNIIYEIELGKEIKSVAVDTEKDIAVAVSDTEITLIDINTGKILSTIKTDNANSVAINHATHIAVIADGEGFLLLDLNTQNATRYTLNAARSIAVDKYRNTALFALLPLSKGGQGVVEIQLPNPVPKITNLVPKAARAGESGFSLKVEGEKFITTSSVQFDQNNLSTTFKDNAELEAQVPSSLIATPSTVPVTVTNPAPDGGVSEPYPFTIKYPVPVLQSITPNTIAARSPDFTLKVNGSNFYPGYAVNFNGQDLTTTYINSGELNAIVPSALIATKGIYLVVVKTPDGQNSNFLNFTVTDPYPVITDFSPKSGQAGTVVTITGDNFNYTPTKIYFPPYQGRTQGGVQSTIQSLTQTEIKAIVPIGASTGPLTVTTTIGSTQSAEPFTVFLRNDFALNISPQSVSIPLNGNAGAIISLQSTGLEQFTGLVKLTVSVSSVSDSITANFNPENIAANQSSILNIKLTSTLTSASTLTISGTANIEGAEFTRTATLTLNPIPQGATTITGRIVRSKDSAPIKGVTLTIGDKTTVTDEAGNFLFIDAPVGEQTLMIDGGTANTPEATYPSRIPAPVTIIGGIDNKLPYFIYLHAVNTKTFTPINPAIDTIVTDPEIKNFEMKIPQGVQIIGWDGLPNEKVSVTLVPMDRLAIKPPPEGVYASEIFMYYFGKPGGGIPTQPIPVKMPNTFNGQPGDRVVLWYYDESPTPDPNSNQWKTFGMGTVSNDGRNIIPDPGVGIPKFCCGASRPQPVKRPQDSPQGSQPSPKGGGPCKIGGNSVDPYNGMQVHSETDIGYPSSSLISLSRHYKSDNTNIGTFGRGTSTDYDHYLQGSGNALTYITPEAGRYILSKNADGSYTSDQYPFLKNVKAYLNGDNTRTLKFKDSSSYTFDTNGRLTRQTDANANYISITRDSLGNITGISDSFGKTLYITNRTITIGLSIYTVISSIMDSSGRIVTYAYDSSARLTTITNPDGGKTTYTYDSSGRLTSITNPRGIVEETIEYDSQGRVFRQINADGGEYRFYYFSPSTPVRVQDLTNPASATCTPQFVREGEQAGANTCGIIYLNVPTSTAVPQGSTATTTIAQTVAIYPNKSSITHRFNSQGYLLSTTDGQGGQTTNDLRISTNELVSVTDKGGRKTGYIYDSNGNIASITDPAGNVTTYEYDLTFNKPTKITDALNNITTMSYDSKGNLIRLTTPDSRFTSISYNSYGQPISITDALNNTTTFTYDSYGNLIKATDPLGNSAQMQYDFIGRLIKAIDAKGKSTSYVYDLMNRITEVADALNGKTKFTYDANGNLLTVNDAKNQTITYSYNVRDKVATMTDQLGKVETYSYDKNDNLVSVKDRKDQTTNLVYDMLNRITKTKYADSSYIDYVYDAVGRMNYINDSLSGAIQYVYSNTGCNAGCSSSFADKVIKEITALGTISYDYNAIGSRTGMTVSSQEPVTYQYNANSRLIQINQGTQTVSINHDSIGRRTSMTLPNGIVTTYSYDTANRLTDINYSFDSQIVKSLNYGYDKNGNRTSFNGHKTLLPDPKVAAYNQANQQIQVDNETLIYDENGNLIQKGNTTYTWNARNQFVSITSPSYNASFKYDALGRRIEKTINGKTISYLYDGWDIIQEIENGTVTTNYLRGLNIDETLGIIRQDSVYYYLTDALGSTIALTDPSRNIATEYFYDPFGNTQTSNPNIYNPFQYTGRENDGNGHYNYRWRYKVGERFASEDPIGLAGGINKFVYVHNRPTMLRDPLGLYGTNDCSYYEQRCKESGGKYYCETVQFWCNAFPKYPDPDPTTDDDFEGWPRCTRKCLQDCDQEQYKCEKDHPNPDPSTDRFFDWKPTSCHIKCYTQCGAGQMMDWIIPTDQADAFY